MCGIFGFVGNTDRPTSVVVEGLKDLEYRGYDSWGVAVAAGGGVLSEKQTGKIGDAVSSLPPASASLGHTRWATHGAVTQQNAHPHLDCSGRLAVIHNGIVENHDAIRGRLQRHQFRSETDTEVVVHLLEEEMAGTAANGRSRLVTGLMSGFRQLEGLSAIAVLDGESGEIAAAKNGSPLVVGLSEEGSYLASDPVALLPHTRKLLFVEDGQAVSLDPSGTARVFEVGSGREIEPQVREVDWPVHDRTLGPFDHYMEKEINEQPAVLRRLAAEKSDDVSTLARMIEESSRVFITGCGTANNAGMAGQYLMSRIAGRQVTAVMASEMRLAGPLLDPTSLVIALSQSGETIDVLDAARLAQSRGARVAALTNSEGSSLYRLADHSILLDCGPERCVLATKTYTAKLALLVMTAYQLAGRAEEGVHAVVQGALLMEALLVEERDRGNIERLAERLADSDHIFVLGRDINYPLALEAALKIKEVSYIHAEGFASGELKHGVIALIEPGTPCIVLATEPSVLRETLAGTAEVRARGAFTVGLSPDPHPEFEAHLPMRGGGEAVLFEAAAAFQSLAYRLALRLERDPDKPRNLAKSVTVR